jgi:hypothetical protein
MIVHVDQNLVIKGFKEEKRLNFVLAISSIVTVTEFLFQLGK